MINEYLLAFGVLVVLTFGTMKIRWEKSSSLTQEIKRYAFALLIKLIPVYVGLLLIIWGFGF